MGYMIDSLFTQSGVCNLRASCCNVKKTMRCDSVCFGGRLSVFQGKLLLPFSGKKVEVSAFSDTSGYLNSYCNVKIYIHSYYKSHLHLLCFRHFLLLADSLLVRTTVKQQKADKLSHCDLMIELRIYFVEDTKGNMYRLV